MSHKRRRVTVCAMPKTRPSDGGLARAVTLLEQAATAVPIPRPPWPIVVADYGRARTDDAMHPLGVAVTALRPRTRPEHSVLVTHTAPPDRDFSRLFGTLTDHPESYLKKDPAVFASAVGRSWLTQILPSNSVNLAWSAGALDWLSRTPRPVPDHVLAAAGTDDEVHAEFDRQAAHEWHEFIAFRGRELSPGGRLVVVTSAQADDDPQGHTVGHRAVFDMIAVAVTDLVGREVISPAEAAVMTLPIVSRRVGDFHAPFAPSGTFEKMSIAHLETVEAEDPFWAQYRTDHDAAALGQRWADWARIEVLPALASSLDSDRRAPVTATIAETVAERFAASPTEIRVPLALIVIEKQGRDAE
jgi:salicylate 1-O-methyltransferase